MRRVSTFNQRQGVMELKMTSLIDVVFQLLIFFVWTASFQVTEYVLPSSISAAKTQASLGAGNTPPPPEADFPDLVVRIVRDVSGIRWRVNEDAVADLVGVRERLGAVFEIHRDAPVIIHPDPTVPLGDVIDVYDLARGVGFAKVQFAASQEPTP